VSGGNFAPRTAHSRPRCLRILLWQTVSRSVAENASPLQSREGFTAVLVVHEANRVIGYYGLAPTAVLPSTLSRSIRIGQPPNPVPCLLLGQLATDQNWMGKGVGSGLLKHALQRCVAAANLVGGRALIVNAVDVEAAKFWTRRGFIPSKDDPLILFRSISDIAASLGPAV
jgi:GNAT superfamily N-acetyltransferase